MKFLPHTVFILVLFLPNADASDYDIFMRRGLETLYLQEAEKYVTCRQYTRLGCNFSEVEGFLRLLALYSPDERIAPIYPRQAQQSGYHAVVVAELTINDDGTVQDLETLSCESGLGDHHLKLNWRLDGKYCGRFSLAAERAFKQYRFREFPPELLGVQRRIQWRAMFTLTGQTSDDINKQVTDLKSSQVRKIQEFSKANDWTALEAYALNHLDKQKVFRYFAADSAWKLGKKTEAIDHFTHFVKDGGSSYWHFGAKAAAVTISHYYQIENDQEVADLGRASMLEAYLDRGNVVTKAAISDALWRYASSLTLIEQPEIAKAFIILTGIKRHELRHGGIPENVMEMVNQQISNIESQIIVIGRSKVEQARAM